MSQELQASLLGSPPQTPPPLTSQADPHPGLGFPGRPPCVCGRAPGQDPGVPAVRRPAPEVPPAAPTRPEPRQPGHTAHTSLLQAAIYPGPVCCAQALGPLTEGALACAADKPPGPGEDRGRPRFLARSLGVLRWQGQSSPEDRRPQARALAGLSFAGSLSSRDGGHRGP